MRCQRRWVSSTVEESVFPTSYPNLICYSKTFVFYKIPKILQQKLLIYCLVATEKLTNLKKTPDFWGREKKIWHFCSIIMKTWGYVVVSGINIEYWFCVIKFLSYVAVHLRNFLNPKAKSQFLCTFLARYAFHVFSQPFSSLSSILYLQILRTELLLHSTGYWREQGTSTVWVWGFQVLVGHQVWCRNVCFSGVSGWIPATCGGSGGTKCLFLLSLSH